MKPSSRCRIEVLLELMMGVLLELMKEIAVEYGAQARAAIAKATGESE